MPLSRCIYCSTLKTGLLGHSGQAGPKGRNGNRPACRQAGLSRVKGCQGCCHFSPFAFLALSPCCHISPVCLVPPPYYIHIMCCGIPISDEVGTSGFAFIALAPNNVKFPNYPPDKHPETQGSPRIKKPSDNVPPRRDAFSGLFVFKERGKYVRSKFGPFL